MGLFGQPLPIDGPVPDIFETCLNHLELHALEVEGIFRISGQKIRIDEIKAEFERGSRYEFTEKDDIHDVSGVFRLWLQQLPEPIIPYEFYNTMVTCGRLEGKAVRAPLKEMADELPPVRRLMLQKLIRLLRLLSLYHETNKMTAVNLAVVMGPNICRPRVMTLSSEALSQTQCVTNAVVGLIDEYEFILPREPPSSDKYLTQAKRESGIFTFDATSPNLERVPSSGKVSLASKEAEDAVSTKLALSLSELSPDASALKTPQSARGAANRNRSRGASAAAKNRGFSNALEWLVTSVQDDVLEEVIADKDDSPEPASDEVSSSSSATKLKRSKKSKSPSNGSKQGDDETAETGSEASITSPPKRERSKKLKSSSSANSTETSSTSASEPASPREPKGLTDSSSSSTKKKKKSTSTSLSRSNLELPSPVDSSEDPPKSPRRRIAPPSREASENSGEY